MSEANGRLRRILTLIPILRSRQGVAIRELCLELGASRKEIMGDLRHILFCGVPPYLPHDYILATWDDDDCVHIDFADHFARPARLNLREALSLKLAIETLPPLDGDQAEAAQEILEAVDALLKSQEDWQSLEALKGRIAFPKPEALSSSLSQLQGCLKAQREIQIRYYSASSDQVTERWVRPYALVDRGGHDYLIADCLKSHEQRSFRVDRIRAILNTQGAAFERPEDLAQQIHSRKIRPPESAGVRVKARFAAAIAPWIREDYADDVVKELPDGQLLVEFTAGSVVWAVQKLMGYGELVEVLAPPTVRQEMQRRLERLISDLC